MNYGKYLTYKVWGIRIKIDDILGAVVFYIAIRSLLSEAWGGVFLFAALGLALAIPEDDGPRQWMEAVSAFGIIYCTVLLADLPIPLMPFGIGLEGSSFKVIRGVALTLGWTALIANLLEILPVLGKALWELFRKPAEGADERRKKALEKRLNSLE
ncbi:hypothetical protein HYV12_02180 [Candidatus Dojkabacteria bacterium]|nr:hypothetical protein [Candidatus Dojkabacteria bacterium]